MLRVLIWEFGKLFRFRSVQAGLIATMLVPLLWAFAPGLLDRFDLVLVSGWQVPGLSLRQGISFFFPFLVSMAVAEIVGSEVSMGTLKSLLLRPSPRWKLLSSKIVVALSYPFILLFASMLGSLIFGGITSGLGSFFGGTGVTATEFQGEGVMSPGFALAELVRAHLLAGLSLWPLAAMTLLFSVIFLSTTSSALASIATQQILAMVSIAIPSIFSYIFTNYQSLFSNPPGTLAFGTILMLIYTAGFSILAVMLFEKKDI